MGVLVVGALFAAGLLQAERTGDAAGFGRGVSCDCADAAACTAACWPLLLPFFAAGTGDANAACSNSTMSLAEKNPPWGLTLPVMRVFFVGGEASPRARTAD